MTQTVLAGIDVSAKELVVTLEPNRAPAHTVRFHNNPAGHRQLLKVLTKKRHTARVALEATGVYSLDLALALHRAPRVEVMVANPRAVSDFAKALMERSKTDPVDADVLLEFVRRMPFVAWQPPEPKALELRAISRRIAALTLSLGREKNRLHHVSQTHQLSALVRRDIEVNIRHLKRRIAYLEDKAVDLAWEHPRFRVQLAHLTSVQGIARTSAIRILAELAVLPHGMTSRQWVAHAGLDPRHVESGTSVHKPGRISRTGNKYLRAALFMPALVAVQHEPKIRAFHQKLTARGKKPMQAYVAVMRKLLHSIHGMLTYGEDFDGEKFCRLEPKTA